MAGPLADNPFAHLAGVFFTARNDPEVLASPGGPAQYVWASIRSDFLRQGEPLPPNSIQAVNEMWKWSSRVENADNNLARALTHLETTGYDTALTSAHIGDAIDARSLSERPLGDQHIAIYKWSYSVEGQEFTDIIQHDFGYDLPETVAGLRDALNSAAEVAAADYGFQWTGTATPISIRAY